jgi:hypothetical protein
MIPGGIAVFASRSNVYAVISDMIDRDRISLLTSSDNGRTWSRTSFDNPPNTPTSSVPPPKYFYPISITEKQVIIGVLRKWDSDQLDSTHFITSPPPCRPILTYRYGNSRCLYRRYCIRKRIQTFSCLITQVRMTVTLHNHTGRLLTRSLFSFLNQRSSIRMDNCSRREIDSLCEPLRGEILRYRIHVGNLERRPKLVAHDGSSELAMRGTALLASCIQHRGCYPYCDQ